MPQKKRGARTVYKRAYDTRRRVTHRSVHLTIPREEYEIFAHHAEELGLSVPRAILALARAQAQLAPPPIPEEVHNAVNASLRLIRRTGHLINQWCRAYHQKSQLNETDTLSHRKKEHYLYHQLQTAERLIKRGLLHHE